jgi:hypothetical protein
LSQGWLLAKDTALLLGLCHEQHSCFDYKPWVESEIGKWGIPTIPWRYVRTLRSSIVTELLDQGASVVVRLPRSRGGAGIWLIHDRLELESVVEPPGGEGLFCIAPYFESGISVNVNACVFPQEELSIHGTSVQLVGIDVCTPRVLGYAGNDFASIADLPVKALRSLDSMTRSLAAWLGRRGYLGAFGFDALILGDRAVFVEINPRFQASSVVASYLDREIGRPDQYLNHIAAFLGLRSPDRLSLPDLIKEQKPLSQVMVYNGQNRLVVLHKTPELPRGDVRLLPSREVVVEPGGILAAVLWGGRVTETGRDLWDGARSAVLDVVKCFLPADRGSDWTPSSTVETSSVT